MTYNWDSVLLFRLGAALVCAALLGAAAPVQAKVFLGRNDALAWAFPAADHVEDATQILSLREVTAVETLGGGVRESRLVTVYTGYRGKSLLGYALIDIHNVRTHPEAFLIVLSPRGEVVRLRVLAFHEPLEYLPPERWLEQFPGAKGDARMRVGHDVHGIAGSTLTAQAVTGGIRRAIALYRVLLAEE